MAAAAAAPAPAAGASAGFGSEPTAELQLRKGRKAGKAKKEAPPGKGFGRK